MNTRTCHPGARQAIIETNAAQLIKPPVADGIENISSTFNDSVLREVRESWPRVIPERVRYLPEALELICTAKGSGFVFVIDEWDCPMREAMYNEPLQKNWLDFLRDLFKGAPYVEAAYMTGILPIRKYGKHSALNLFDEYSMIDPDVLAPLPGFNADEVEALCARFDKDPAEISRWYDGYLLGPNRTHVFNPRSVSGAMRSLSCRGFWTDTDTYEALRSYIDMDFDGVQTDLVAMLDGQYIPADVSTFKNSMTDIDGKDDMYALLVHLGYLGYDQTQGAVFIPNEEIRREFATSIRQGARPQLARLVRESRDLQRRTIEGDAEYVADAIERAHESAAGPHHLSASSLGSPMMLKLQNITAR